ncbi:ankyrin repeat domain-containing protein [Alcaligenaceae bacterium]|nr:ankyrin repeat domain-containing protein [Alcaligenaceae bacterium]
MIKPLIATTSILLTLMSPYAFPTETTPPYPLHDAAQRDSINEVKQLLLSGNNIETRDKSGSTALLVATRANAVNAARTLIEAGANVNAKDNINDSAYLYSGARGHLDILKMTLTHGADLNSTNRYGGTALIPAAERGHVQTVLALIKAGVAVDHVNNLGWTALLEAIILGNGGEAHQQIVSILLDAGANPNLPDRDGVTPLQHARDRGYQKIEQALLAANAHQTTPTPPKIQVGL